MRSVGSGWSISTVGTPRPDRPRRYTGPGRVSPVPVTGRKTVHVPVMRAAPEAPTVHAADRDGSVEGPAAVTLSKETMQRKLLAAFHGAGPRGFTDEEAAEAAGLTDTCYWKRAGDLRAQGLIVYTGQRRRGRKGVSRKVSAFVPPDEL